MDIPGLVGWSCSLFSGTSSKAESKQRRNKGVEDDLESKYIYILLADNCVLIYEPITAILYSFCLSKVMNDNSIPIGYFM